MLDRSSGFVIAVILAVVSLNGSASAGGLTAAEQAGGFVALFDGSDVSAWRGYRNADFPQTGWTVDDGSLKVGAGGGDLITRAQYRNFELRLEFKVSPGANSGIMYRVTEEHGAPWQSGPEMQVLDDAGHEMSGTESHSSGGLYGLYDCPPDKVQHAAGQFNTARIVMRDGVVRHYLNGMKVVEADLNSDDWTARVAASKFNAYAGFGASAVGHICLQDHGDEVWYRNIRIRDLDHAVPGEIDLLAGDRLDQWTAHLNAGAALTDVFSFDGDVLVDRGVPVGYMRTNAVYTNYVLRLQWRFDPVTKVPGNSGVLLRMVGEDKVWPRSIEAQLHSGSAGDFWNIGEFVMTAAPERTRGRNTKHTHANERPIGEWNNYEIIVNGGRIVLVVNDEVVNEARHVEEIAGFICLQAEGVPIHFRNIRLVQIAE